MDNQVTAYDVIYLSSKCRYVTKYMTKIKELKTACNITNTHTTTGALLRHGNSNIQTHLFFIKGIIQTRIGLVLGLGLGLGLVFTRGQKREKASHQYSACYACNFLIVLRAHKILLLYKLSYIAENIVISAPHIAIADTLLDLDASATDYPKPTTPSSSSLPNDRTEVAHESCHRLTR